MALLRKEPVQYGSVLPGNGVFDGQLFVLVVEASDNILYMWNANDDAWEPVSGDAAALVATSLTAASATITTAAIPTLTGAVTMSGAVAVSGALSPGAGISWDSGNIIRYAAKVSVTATQLRTLAAAPVSIVAGVAGDAVVFRGALFSYRGGANIFDSVGAGEDLALRYTDGSGTIVSYTVDTTSDINFGSTTDVDFIVEPVGSVVATLGAALALDNVGAGELAAADADVNGDGTLDIYISYDVVNVAA
jgi:hypothetical protein